MQNLNTDIFIVLILMQVSWNIVGIEKWELKSKKVGTAMLEKVGIEVRKVGIANLRT